MFIEPSVAEIYVISAGYYKIKIGYSKSAERRMKAMQGHTADNLTLEFKSEPLYNYNLIERTAHKILKSYKLKGEWFSVTPDVAIETVKEAIKLVQEGREKEIFVNKKYVYDKLTISVMGVDKELFLKIKHKLEEKHKIDMSMSQIVSNLIRERAILEQIEQP